MEYRREVVKTVVRMLREGPQLLHILIGARQVGKTTAASQISECIAWPAVFAAADTPLPPGPEWVESQWARARETAQSTGGPALLVLDEVQKVRGWSETVKRLWDEDRRARRPIRVLLLGSSALLLTKGLSESLSGRFFLHRCPHWTWVECRQAFGLDLPQWLYFGGYPGAVAFMDREADWRRYIADALIETVVARDVLSMQTVAKPALLLHLFALSAAYPAQILSYNKMLGQLQDAGNTTTLAHYLRLLETAFLVSGLEKFSRGSIRTRGSSPKLILWNQALINALSPRSFREAKEDPVWWGRIVENAVGAHLVNHLHGPEWNIGYWREGNAEVDFVVSRADRIHAMEVKSGRSGRTSGPDAFRARYPKARILLIGGEGIPLEEFLGVPPESFLT